MPLTTTKRTSARLTAVTASLTLLAGGATVRPAHADTSTSSSTTTVTTKVVTLKKKTVKVKTSKLRKGITKVASSGRDGKATRTYRTTTVNGKTHHGAGQPDRDHQAGRQQGGPVGTKGKYRAESGPGEEVEEDRQCESTNRWHINTGNGYYGGLQFNLATWRSVKGQNFAKYPHKATKAEQITVANRLHKKRGFQPWGCRHVL
ncbi:MAG: transglycosylase family protein [Micropruina sp.]